MAWIGCTTFNQNRKDLRWNENIPPYQQKKSSRWFHQPARLAHCVLGHARDHTAEIPASWWEYKCRVVLHHSVRTPTGYSLQATWTPDKGSDSSGWQCLLSHSKTNTGAVTNISLGSPGTSTIQSRLSPQWFSSVWAPKNHLGGQHFANDDAVIQEVTRWLQQQPKDFFFASFQGLVKRWDKCLNIQDDYVQLAKQKVADLYNQCSPRVLPLLFGDR